MELKTQIKKRNHLTIIARILECAIDGAKKTKIMYEANLSYTQLESYLPFLVKLGLMDKNVLKNITLYKTTRKGLSFLEKFKELTEILTG